MDFLGGKRLNRSNRSSPISNDPDGVSTGVPTPRMNTSPNTGNCDADKRNRSNEESNSKCFMKNKGIQCRECEGFGHIQAECANTLKKKNKSPNATWSGRDSDCSKEDDTDMIAFASRSDVTGGDSGASSSRKATGVSKGVPTLSYESSDDEDLTEEELIQAYRLIHTKWTELTKICEKMSVQIKQSNVEKNELQKINSDLESKLKESQDSVATLTAELESMKKSVKMLNSNSSKLDEILNTGRTDKTHVGLGYTGSEKIGSTQTVFVKASPSGVKIHDDLKQKASVATPAKTPAVITCARVGVTTTGRTTTASPWKKNEKRWIPTCHYCNRKGHIRPRCYQYFADLRRENQERFPPRRPVKQEWVKKSESRCHIARTPIKAMKEINVKEKIFCEKQVADMQGELDLCGGVEKSGMKYAERGRMPLFLIFLCLFLAKRGSKC